jgi:hypothetical protein
MQCHVPKLTAVAAFDCPHHAVQQPFAFSPFASHWFGTPSGISQPFAMSPSQSTHGASHA